MPARDAGALRIQDSPVRPVHEAGALPVHESCAPPVHESCTLRVHGCGALPVHESCVLRAHDAGALRVHHADMLRVHAFVPRSRANGPGIRAVLWLQGCSLRCPGCFNPDTHSTTAGECVSVEELCARLAALPDGIEGFAGLEGLTVSGGEPLEQPRPLRALLKRLRQGSPLSVVLFTGYTWQEVRGSPEMAAALPLVDVLVAGRYDHSRRLAHGLRGSENQTTHFLTSRYSERDLETVPVAEIEVGPDGEIIASGIDPPEIAL